MMTMKWSHSMQKATKETPNHRRDGYSEMNHGPWFLLLSYNPTAFSRPCESDRRRTRLLTLFLFHTACMHACMYSFVCCVTDWLTDWLNMIDVRVVESGSLSLFLTLLPREPTALPIEIGAALNDWTPFYIYFGVGAVYTLEWVLIVKFCLNISWFHREINYFYKKKDEFSYKFNHMLNFIIESSYIWKE